MAAAAKGSRAPSSATKKPAAKPTPKPKATTRSTRSRTATAQPSGALGARGQKLRDQLVAMKTFNPAETVMLDELCRMADRLEAINDLVASKGLASLLHLRRMDDYGEEHGEVVIKVTIDGVLAEARQLQLAFQRMADALKIEAGEAAKGEGDVSDDLAEKRARDLAARAAHRAPDAASS